MEIDEKIFATFAEDNAAQAKRIRELENGRAITAIGMAVLSIVINLTIGGGLIYFAFWCLKHFGVI